MFLYIIFWLLAIWHDLVYILRIVIRYPWIRFDRPIVINRDGTATPVLLVHGCSGNQSEWIPALPLIEKAFPTHPIYAFSLDLDYNPVGGTQIGGNRMTVYGMKRLANRRNGSIDDYVDELEIRRQQLNIEKCILIGHSMGGVTAAKYECMYPDHVERVICFSSPLRGAPMLRFPIVQWWLSSKRHRQMIPGSEFLHEIDRRVYEHTHKYVTFGSHQDPQVPFAYSTLPFIVKSYICNGYGHFSIVSDPLAWRHL